MDILKPRCPVCDWPLQESKRDGCVPGDCSYRPEQGTEEYRRIQIRRLGITIPEHQKVQS